MVDDADGDIANPTGAKLTVIALVATTHPLPRSYVIVALPGDTPVTTPEALTVAIDVLLLVHAPPVLASVSVVVVDGHTSDEPAMLAGVWFTVTTEVT
jgi:hypothetical protein